MRHDALVGCLRPSSDLHLLIAQRLDVVGVGRIALVALLLWLACLQFEPADLVGHEARAARKVVGLLGQQVPAEHGEFARRGHRGDLVTAPGTHPHEEGVQRPRRLGGGPGGLDQHRPSVAAARLADAPEMGGSETGLTHTRIEPEVAHQLLRAGEATHFADRGGEPGGHRHVDAGDGEQAAHHRAVERRLADRPVEDGEILAQGIEFAQVTPYRRLLVIGQSLPFQPSSADPAEQVGMRAWWHEVGVQHRVGLVLKPRSMADHLDAPRDEPRQPLGHCIRRPDLRQEPGRIEVGEHAGVDHVGLHVRMGDRLDLQRVGDHDARHVRAQKV